MPRTGGATRSRRRVNTKAPAAKPLDETLVEESSDPEQEQSGSPEYSVEAIIRRRGYGSEREYNVKWKGWPSADNTWEPMANLAHCQQLVDECDRLEDEREREKQQKSAKRKGALSRSKGMALDDGPSTTTNSKKATSSKPKRKKKRAKGEAKRTAVVVEEHSESGFQVDAEEDFLRSVDGTGSPQIATKRLLNKRSSKMVGHSEDDEHSEDTDGGNKEGDDPEKLEKADSDWDEDEVYEVEYVVKHRAARKSGYPKRREDGERAMEYFVKWKGWDPSTNTWEHEHDLSECTKLIDAYWDRKELEKTEKERLKNERAALKKAEKERKRRDKELKKKEAAEIATAEMAAAEIAAEKEKETEAEAERNALEKEMEDEIEAPAETEAAELAEGDPQKKGKNKKKKRRRKTNHRATRVFPTASSDDEEEATAAIANHEDEAKSPEAEREDAETLDIDYNLSSIRIMDTTDIPIDSELIDSPKARNPRKRSLFEVEDDDVEMTADHQPPPLKRRRVEETRMLIESQGVDLFFKVLDGDSLKDQDMLMDLVQKYH